MIKFVSYLMILIGLFTSLALKAEISQWQIIPDESSIKFTGTQNNAPVSGEFKNFSGDIRFDSKQLKDSKIKIVVDTSSVAAGFVELTDMLKTMPWFDTTHFPQATFESQTITQKNKNTYEATGVLKIKDKKNPMTIDFLLDEDSPANLRLHGTTLLKRTTFGVGQGDWASTAEIKDEVSVKFMLTLKKAKATQ